MPPLDMDMDGLSLLFSQLGLRSKPSFPRPVVPKDLNDLPAELLHLVCNYLDIVDLKSFRLAHKRFRDIGVSHLFCEARLCSDLESLKRLEHVASHPIAKHVKSLDCVAKVPKGYFGMELVMSTDFEYTRGLILAENAGGEAAYQEFIQAWTKAWGHYPGALGQSPCLSVLLKGLVSLESIKFSAGTPIVPNTPTHRTCTYLHHGRFFVGVLRACQLAGVALEKLVFSDVNERILHLVNYREHSRELNKFPCLWRVPNGYELRNILTSLTTLKLRIGNIWTRRWPHAPHVRDNFATVLSNMSNLQVLDIAFLDIPALLSSVLRESLWPTLESLSLGYVGIHEPHFMSFLEKHTSSLKVLELNNIILVGSCGQNILRPLRDWVMRSKLEFISVKGPLREIHPIERAHEDEDALNLRCKEADWKPDRNEINLHVLKYLTYGQGLTHDAEVTQAALTGIHEAIYEAPASCGTVTLAKSG
ncbi:hypothetical protein BU16DRAFT_566228 [Lophium mytilinum]|uniref:F-box domain-containing protein n=1 Tax=Lophium mytilinum TaxID=390894 RepID=A0A6A6QDM0_9PEZI|nr:hypothetical protein BU16DRAFT_566228 [Lophium mytilinum]